LFSVTSDTYDIVDDLGIVSSFAVPPQDVEDSVVCGMLPVAEIVIDFVPSELWSIVLDADTAATHPFPVIVKVLDALVLVPSMVMEKEPVPLVVYPVLFRL
jgi:hypothetical protein